MSYLYRSFSVFKIFNYVLGYVLPASLIIYLSFKISENPVVIGCLMGIAVLFILFNGMHEVSIDSEKLIFRTYSPFEFIFGKKQFCIKELISIDATFPKGNVDYETRGSESWRNRMNTIKIKTLDGKTTILSTKIYKEGWTKAFSILESLNGKVVISVGEQ